MDSLHENEPQRPVTVKRLQPRKLSVTVVIAYTETGKTSCVECYKLQHISMIKAQKSMLVKMLWPRKQVITIVKTAKNGKNAQKTDNN